MKKILYIGHSYHKKTQSTAFLVELLQTKYIVDVIHDENWKENKSPDTTKISTDYDAVIFFQVIPTPKEFKKVQHPNILFFPMYDGFDFSDITSLYAYKDVKFVNFSKTVHEKLSKWGFNSLYVQYFIEPTQTIKEINHRVFFWQRTDFITINTVSKLFSSVKAHIHCHKSIDPNHTFVQPSSQQEKDFSITYSTWFDTKKDLEACILQNTFYIAPRISEGIGMSFLEAMAKGMIVIAHDAPTMNEYITHGETGFLFNYQEAKALDFTTVDLGKVSKDTINYMEKGFKKWEKDKSKIINYVKAELQPRSIFNKIHYFMYIKFTKKIIRKILRKMKRVCLG